MTRNRLVVLLLCALFAYPLRADSGPARAPSVPASAFPGLIPLTDLGPGSYQGFQGGLYENGTNLAPADHAAEGLRRAAVIHRLNTSGQPSLTGKIVMMSVGMSNAYQEWCGTPTGFDQSGLPNCNSWTFAGQAYPFAVVALGPVRIVNGACGGCTVDRWDSLNDEGYAGAAADLASAGLSEAQVQVVWAKLVHAGGDGLLPNPNADAFVLKADIAKALRAMKLRYPNLRQVFLSSRIFGGYAQGGTSPEPSAYETGFAVKWVIQAQINQMRGLGVDPQAGDLNYATVAPWVAWGAYLWANGTTPRSDGLVWLPSDFEGGAGIHPSQSGEQKVGTLLRDFFRTSLFTRPWFLGGISTVALYNPMSSAYFLRNLHSAGGADLAFVYGAAGSGWMSLGGDWDGDGDATVGGYNSATATMWLRQSNSPGPADVTLQYGVPGSGWIPLAGDWNGDGIDTVGLYSPSAGTFFLRNTNTPGTADLMFPYGLAAAGWMPIVGDWDGDGDMTVGMYNPATSAFMLRNSNTAGPAETFIVFGVGGAGWIPVAGDWDGDGDDTIGLYNPVTSFFMLRNTNSAGAADLTFQYGAPGIGLKPVIGDWDGL